MKRPSREPLESTPDMMGTDIKRGSYILYGYQEGYSAAIRVSKVLDIYGVRLYREVNPKPRLCVQSVAEDWNGELRLGEATACIQRTTAVLVIDPSVVGAQYRDLLDPVEVTQWV